MKRFKKVYVEIINICNLACEFCPETKRPPEIMSIESFSHILDQIKPYTDYIYFHVKGEPLFHPEIDKLLDICGEKGFKVNLTTNGTLINKVKEKLLTKKALRQINFSLHSIKEDEKTGAKQEYINNILSFSKEAVDKSDIIISLRLWNLHKDNSINKEIQKNRKMLDFIEKEFNLNYKIEEKVLPGRGVKIHDRIYLNQEHLFQWPDLEEAEDNVKGFCYGLRNQAAILADGRVVPCCLDGNGIINLGNINDTPFSEIIESTRANSIVDGFSRREAVEELCRKCGYKQRFGK